MKPGAIARRLARGSLTWFGAILILLSGATANTRAAALPGPASLTTGFVDDPEFLYASPLERMTWFGRARQLGAQEVRITVPWSSVTPPTRPAGFDAVDPADPRYHWSDLDAAVRGAAANGEIPLITVYHAPQWAEGPNRPRGDTYGAWEPDPAALGAFATALARRYSGGFPDPLRPGLTLPAVTHFQAWNEPNLTLYLMPQWSRTARGAIVPESPNLYRVLLDRFYQAVKAVQPRSTVLAAGTAPYGDPPGGFRMPPVIFLRGLFCLSARLGAERCPTRPELDGLDHHPYTTTPTESARSVTDVAVADLDRIQRIVRAAERAHHVLPAGPKPLWITEVAFPALPYTARSAARQAADLALVFYELWRQGVSHVYWFTLRDRVPAGGAFDGVGLYRRSGVAKPAAAAYRFPFIAIPGSGNTTIIWGRAPGPGTVLIQEQTGGRWRSVVRLPSTRAGVFYARRRLLGTEFRAQFGALVSPAWSRG